MLVIVLKGYLIVVIITLLTHFDLENKWVNKVGHFESVGLKTPSGLWAPYINI